MYNKPQKSRKHKKIKAIDPFNVKAVEERKKQNTKNLPPKNDEQEVPRAFKELLLMGQQMEKDAANKRRKRKTKGKKNDGDDEFVKHKWENEQQFLSRVNRETSNFVNEQLLKIKYDIQEKQNQDDLDDAETDDCGSDEDYKSRNLAIRKENELLSSIVKKQSTSNQKGTIPKKKRKKKKNKADPLRMKEHVAFGERNDNPPNLVPFIGKLSKKQPMKKNLLLDKVLSQVENTKKPYMESKGYLNDGTIKCDNKQKRKMLQEERNRIIEAYRCSKKQKVL